jgi:predicted nucleic acid-binding protein
MTDPVTVAVDANFFLRAIVQATSPDTIAQAEISRGLFRGAVMGELFFTTNSAVIAEVVFILSSARHYGMAPDKVADSLSTFLSLPTCVLIGKRQVIAALDRWRSDPKLSFVDCLILEQSLAEGIPLATFDKRLRTAAGEVSWEY